MVSACSGKPTCVLSCPRCSWGVVFETVPMFVWLTIPSFLSFEGRLSNISFLCLGIVLTVSQAPQHFSDLVRQKSHVMVALPVSLCHDCCFFCLPVYLISHLPRPHQVQDSKSTGVFHKGGCQALSHVDLHNFKHISKPFLDQNRMWAVQLWYRIRSKIWRYQKHWLITLVISWSFQQLCPPSSQQVMYSSS